MTATPGYFGDMESKRKKYNVTIHCRFMTANPEHFCDTESKRKITWLQSTEHEKQRESKEGLGQPPKHPCPHMPSSIGR